uniref:Deoxyribodipyrimidine photo-lyase n=1 Tax=Albugo laibachii Nc14 TaxID=890382 RepID=F0WKY7_9STRA|nr:deoxyribodipyrimidine photolyase putative [Albugo laibachii Nc14]|eukprot:CCA21946.1 deoxyribodipyrimidine photolyase putative [Albugo laibachii Nc14]
MTTIRCRLESSIKSGRIQPERISWLYDGGNCEDTSAKYLLYWMQTSVRTTHNYSLEYAIEAATALSLPLQVIYFFSDRSSVPEEQLSRDPNAFAFSTERHAKFALEGLASTKMRLKERGIDFKIILYRKPTHESENEENEDQSDATRYHLLEKCARDALLVVTDKPYIRFSANDTMRCAEYALERQKLWGLVQVEGDVVVPSAITSDKEEYSARTIRPKVTRQLTKFLVELKKQDISEKIKSSDSKLLCFLPLELFTKEKNSADCVLEIDPTRKSEVLDALDLDRSVVSVDSIIGGEDEAERHTQDFAKNKLSKYAEARNEPGADGSSNLSCYLHYGHISPVWIALLVKNIDNENSKNSRDAFLEEMIVRRELSVNFVVYNPNFYDSFEGIPNFAKKTLNDHRGDKRPHIYSLDDLESGRTDDNYWNAAQLEVVHSGQMHGYMRMYWGKKILEWSETPEEAFKRTVYLNNKYSLDAPHPNSYTGVAWTFGKHDQGWREREIFGKVRCMNETGLKRKFDMDGYIQKIKTMRES